MTHLRSFRLLLSIPCVHYGNKTLCSCREVSNFRYDVLCSRQEVLFMITVGIKLANIRQLRAPSADRVGDRKIKVSDRFAPLPGAGFENNSRSKSTRAHDYGDPVTYSKRVPMLMCFRRRRRNDLRAVTGDGRRLPAFVAVDFYRHRIVQCGLQRRGVWEWTPMKRRRGRATHRLVLKYNIRGDSVRTGSKRMRNEWLGRVMRWSRQTIRSVGPRTAAVMECPCGGGIKGIVYTGFAESGDEI